MSDSGLVRVYMGCSLDGFIAGPEHDITWLSRDYRTDGDLVPSPGALRFESFLGEVGAMLMGRSTFDVITAAGHWSYGDLPVLIATTRPLDSSLPSVRSASGTIVELIEQAREAASGRDVYLDGGDLVRQALAAGLVDELTLTFLPVLLGKGVRLFETLERSVDLQFSAVHPFDGGMAQIRARIRPR